MAENIKNETRKVDEILRELFQGRDAAIEKYAKVRHTQWEMNLWYEYGLPLKEVAGDAKQYFSKRFLNGGKIAQASGDELKEAFTRLDHAVKDGCHGRCTKLVVELNQELSRLGLEIINEPEKFLGWLTFRYDTVPDDWGNPAVEKPYGFEIRIFHDAENRKEFWAELLPMLKAGKVMSMQNVVGIILFRRRRKSVTF